MDSSLHPNVDSFEHPYCSLPEPDRSLHLDADLLAQILGEQSRLRMILFGHPEDVNYEMLNLHHCGYAIDAWSEPQRIPGTVDVITAYSKRSRRVG